jgi:hypothetical protein
VQAEINVLYCLTERREEGVAGHHLEGKLNPFEEHNRRR